MAVSGNKQWVFDVNNLMRVRQMPALCITHAAHSAVIKTPDFPQDSSSLPAGWKGNTRRNFSPLHLGRKTIFLDKLNETMTVVKQWKERKEKTWRESKGERSIKGGEGWRKTMTLSAYIFSFSLALTQCRSIKRSPCFQTWWKHWFNIPPQHHVAVIPKLLSG